MNVNDCRTCKNYDTNDCADCVTVNGGIPSHYVFMWEPTIKDSGQRTEFETGAVRDIQAGKGRCDLMPLDVIAIFYSRELGDDNYSAKFFSEIQLFLTSGFYGFLAEALSWFVQESKFKSWADMLLEVSIHFEEGAKKYGEDNWKKGIPVRRYIDSAIRHYLKWQRGDQDEPHDRAVCWNLMCAAWTCIHKPELNEYLTEEWKNA